MSTEFNLELSATTGLEGVTLGDVSTVSTTIGSTTQSTIPTGGPTTTTTEPVFTTTTKEDTTTTTLEDNVTTTTTTSGPTEITTTTERDSTGADITESDDGTAPTTTQNADVTEFESTDSTNIAHGGNDDVEDDEPEHPTIGWPTKNQNLQVKKIVREFEKILSGFRGKLDDDFIDRWTGENGGIGKFKNNADRIMKSITSSDRDCIDLDTKISNPFKQEPSFEITVCPRGPQDEDFQDVQDGDRDGDEDVRGRQFLRFL